MNVPPSSIGEVPRISIASARQRRVRAQAALRAGLPVPVDPDDAAAVLDIIEAARASAERGELVALRAD
jgi:hypothetical protein